MKVGARRNGNGQDVPERAMEALRQRRCSAFPSAKAARGDVPFRYKLVNIGEAELRGCGTFSSKPVDSRWIRCAHHKM